MLVHVKLLGAANRPVDGISRWFYQYLLTAVNGLIEYEEEEDFIEDGDYELPDEDWKI